MGNTGATADWELNLGNVSPSCGYGGSVGNGSVTLDFTGAGGGAVVVSGGGSGGGNYAATCSGIGLQGDNVLTASCLTVAQQAVTTTLDLDSCIVNNNGSVAWQVNGGYAYSCYGCTLAGTVLACQCLDVSGQSQSVAIDTASNITNCDGTLTCGPCGGAGTWIIHGIRRQRLRRQPRRRVRVDRDERGAGLHVPDGELGHRLRAVA